jgi:hypothetical protein
MVAADRNPNVKSCLLLSVGIRADQNFAHVYLDISSFGPWRLDRRFTEGGTMEFCRSIVRLGLPRGMAERAK